MGSFPRILLSVCLNLMKWMFLATGGLLLVLMVVQQVRGDDGAHPGALLIGAAGMAALGWIAALGSRFFAKAR